MFKQNVILKNFRRIFIIISIGKDKIHWSSVFEKFLWIKLMKNHSIRTLNISEDYKINEISTEIM